MLLESTGTFEGVIVDVPRGTNGFGYDPHFMVPSLGRTAAELSPEEKNELSHRGRATANMLALLLLQGLRTGLGDVFRGCVELLIRRLLRRRFDPDQSQYPQMEAITPRMIPSSSPADSMSTSCAWRLSMLSPSKALAAR